MVDKENEIYCVEYFYAKPGFRKELIAGLLKLVEPTKAEVGCLQYDLLQDPKNENLIILLVKFANKELMNKHENQPYVKEFCEKEMKEFCEKLIWNYGQPVK